MERSGDAMPIPSRFLVCPRCCGTCDVDCTRDGYDRFGVYREYRVVCLCGWVHDYRDHSYSTGLLGG